MLADSHFDVHALHDAWSLVFFFVCENGAVAVIVKDAFAGDTRVVGFAALEVLQGDAIASSSAASDCRVAAVPVSWGSA